MVEEASAAESDFERLRLKEKKKKKQKRNKTWNRYFKRIKIRLIYCLLSGTFGLPLKAPSKTARFSLFASIARIWQLL